MMTLLKYVAYILLIAVLYIVGKGFYDGRFNEETTIGEMENQIQSDGKDMVSSAAKTLKDATH